MAKRFVSIWFPQLLTDWHSRRQDSLKEIPFVLVAPEHGRIIVKAANPLAQQDGIYPGISLADAKALTKGLQNLDEEAGRAEKILTAIAEWCIRFTPTVAIDLPDGLLLEVSGCAHLWGGEKAYLSDVVKRLNEFGYRVRISIADTAACVWGMARFGVKPLIVAPGNQTNALLNLPPAALRIEALVIERLEKLGLRQIHSFINMPRTALRRRFGMELLNQLDKATGVAEEVLIPVHPVELWQERLPCMEPILTATGIEIALTRLLETICSKLMQQQKGLRTAIFKGYRFDGKLEQIDIATTRPSCNTKHLFKLFEQKISSIEPALGIELFVLDAPKVEDLNPAQEKLWAQTGGLEATGLSELLDRVAGKFGNHKIQRYVQDEHYWPERSYKLSPNLLQKENNGWSTSRPRPVQLLPKPETIEVTAPIPDYPPMNFRYKGKLHKVAKADGPERIEQEWWLQEGLHRDYYYLEDEEGCRYWVFRLGHYDTAVKVQWYMHGFFA
jgi:protein ImuB